MVMTIEPSTNGMAALVPSQKTPQLDLIDVDPAFATDLLATNVYQHQRALREQTVLTYAAAMKAGTWSLSTIEMGALPSSVHLLNGQHRLHAVIRSETTQPFAILTHPCETERDLATIYGRIDRGAARRPRDAFAAHELPDELGLTATQLETASSAMVYLLSGFSALDTGAVKVQLQSNDRKLAWLREWAPELRNYFAITARSSFSRTVHRAPILSVAIATLRYRHETALPFWTAVAHPDMRDSTHPATVLLGYLESRVMLGKAVRLVIAKIAANAWNAFYQGRTLSKIAYKPDSAVSINGTPWER